MVKINLTQREIEHAAHHGMRRQVESILEGYKHRGDRNHLPQEEWGNHIEAAISEFVMCKVLNVHWSGVTEMRAVDIGYTDEVRWSPNHNYNLLLSNRDDKKKIYWLVTGYHGEYVVQGWAYGYQVLRDQYCKGAYYIYPKDKLRSVEEYYDRN